MSANTSLLIYAGTHQQYLFYCRSHQLDQHTARYVASPEDLAGRSEAILIRFGTWYERIDRDEVDLLCTVREFEVRDEV